MARSLNKVMLIGNLTRDPELRYTPSGSAVCTFSIATNRSWSTDQGEKKEETDFHRIVAWNKLAELCSQFLVKGRKVYVEGRLTTRSWTAQDGQQKSTTEIVINDMLLIDNQRTAGETTEVQTSVPTIAKSEGKAESKPEETMADIAEDVSSDDQVAPDDIPF